jgi:CHASE3 domain sensor protein
VRIVQVLTAKFEVAVEKMKAANESIAASRRELTILTAKHREVTERLEKLEASIEEKKQHHSEVINRTCFIHGP